VQQLVFSKASKEIVTVQALGGTGGLKIGADFLKQINASAQVWISEPSWENHRQLFEAAGFTVKSYPYYEPKTRGLDFAGMQRGLKAVPSGSIVVLHACCHNPTGRFKQAGMVVHIGDRPVPRPDPFSTWPTKASPTASTKMRTPRLRRRHDTSVLTTRSRSPFRSTASAAR
jgi:hypothetical protein